MAKTEYMVARKTIVFGTAAGPGAKLHKGQRIEASKVRKAYLAKVRDGSYNSRAFIEVVDDEETQERSEDAGGAFDPAEHKVQEVIDYLSSLDGEDEEVDAEIARVKEAEARIEGVRHRPSDRVLGFERSS